MMSEREQINPSDMSVDDADLTFALDRELTKEKQGHLIENDRDAEQIPTRGAAGDGPTRAQPDVRPDRDRDASRILEREDNPLE
jgi:hypothetical protein